MKRRSKHNSGSLHGLRHHLVPAVVWLVTVFCIFGLFRHRAQQVQVLGIARGRTHNVAATCTGRIREVAIQLYDQVEQGQVLLTIDTLSENERITNQHTISELKAEQETLKKNIAFLRAQLITREEQLVDQAVRTQAGRVSNERIFSEGVETAQMQVLDLERQLATKEGDLDRVKDDVETFAHLVEENAMSPFELEQAQRSQKRLEENVQLYSRLLREAQQNRDEAIQRQEEFLALPSSPLAGDVEGIVAVAERIRSVAQKEIDVQLQRMAEIEQRLHNLNEVRIVPMRAPFDGIVSHLSLDVGEVVDTNTPILKLAQVNPTEVLAYVPEAQAERIKAGMKVEVVKNCSPLKIAQDCEVMAVGPTIEQLPTQLWLHPNIPQWGRSFLVQVPVEMNLLVGEKVGIRQL